MSDAIKKKMQTATLVEKTVFANGRLAVFKIEPDSGTRWWYRAGQYTTLGLDTVEHGFVPRAYSIAGSPLDGGLEFYVALVDEGQLTPTMFAQEVGATFYFLSAKGNFTIKQAGKRTLVMVSTGTGLAPFVSHVRTLWKLHQSGVPSPYRVVLFYGVSYSDEFGYREELERYASAAAKKEGFDFTFVCTSSRPDPARGWTPATGMGRVNEVVRHVLAAPIPEGRTVALAEGMEAAALKAHILEHGPDDVAFLTCGNPGMIEDLEEPVKELGVGTYLTEEYWKA
jgi:ferredoxin-NADP reductase